MASKGVSSSENDPPLDLSSLKDHISGVLLGLQSEYTSILDHLILLLQGDNEDNQIQSIHSAATGRFSSKDPEAYDAAAFLFML
jgi:hypothetical protein